MKSLCIRRVRVLGLLALVACAAPIVDTDRDAGVTVPDRWTAVESAAGAVPDRWWTELDSPGLTAAISEALVNNRDLHASAARLSQAIAYARIAGADIYPWVGANAGGSRGRQNFIGLPIPGTSDVLSTTTTQSSVSLDIQWELDLWGRIRAGELAAHADVEAAAAELRAARLSIAAQTAKAWFAVVETRQQLAFARDTAANYRRTTQRVRARFEQGIRPSLDFRLSRVDQSTAEALVKLREEELERATRSLGAFLGRYPDGKIAEETVLPVIRGPVPAGLPSELLERRPDLIAAERRLAAADARLAVAKASLYPRLSLTASGGSRSDELGSLLDGDFRVWSLAGNIFLPLFEGGRLAANVDLVDAERREVYADFSWSVLRAFREVETALAAEGLLAERERLLGIAATEAEAARQLSEDRYNRGLDDIITLLASQRRSVQAQIQWLQIRRQRLDVRIDLLLALGGGFEATAEDKP